MHSPSWIVTHYLGSVVKKKSIDSCPRNIRNSFRRPLTQRPYNRIHLQRWSSQLSWVQFLLLQFFIEQREDQDRQMHQHSDVLCQFKIVHPDQDFLEGELLLEERKTRLSKELPGYAPPSFFDSEKSVKTNIDELSKFRYLRRWMTK